jgi:hypothetical protein
LYPRLLYAAAKSAFTRDEHSALLTLSEVEPPLPLVDAEPLLPLLEVEPELGEVAEVEVDVLLPPHPAKSRERTPTTIKLPPPRHPVMLGIITRRARRIVHERTCSIAPLSLSP